jgi:LysR family transcriptional regulator (chromosome initiation inhibitor)
MKIDNAQLAAFAEAIREGSFEAAARRLHVTPSAISQRIRLLEERLGQVLIQRGAPCRPTAAGRPLLRYAEAAALLEAETLAALGIDGDGAAPAIRIPIVVNADSLDSWFLEVFDALAAGGGLTLDIRVEDQDHSMDWLREGAVMAGVSAHPKPPQGCDAEPLGVMRYRALATPAWRDRHCPGGGDAALAAALAVAPMLSLNAKDALQQAFLAAVGAAGARPPTHFAPTTRAFGEAIRRGLAWGMLPEQLAGAERAQGRLVELRPGQAIDVPLYWHRWRIGSAALDRLSEAVRAAAARALLAP